MMTMEERSEKLAFDLFWRVSRTWARPKQWQDITDLERQHWRSEAKALLEHLFPELLNDPPTAWLAPASCEHSVWTGFRSVNCEIGEGGMEEFTKFYGDFGNFAACWEAARDAFLSRKPAP